MSIFSKGKEPEERPKATPPWSIVRIDNGLKCVCAGHAVQYFEHDQLNGIGAFQNEKPLSAFQLFKTLLDVTPKTLGFVFNGWKIVRQNNGFSFQQNDKELFLTDITLDSIDAEELLERLPKTDDLLEDYEPNH